MSKLSRRTLVATAAALPALAAPALASDAIGASHPDAELLALAAELDPIISEWTAQMAIDHRQYDAWLTACERAGFPEVEYGSMPEEEYRAYQKKRFCIHSVDEVPDEVDEHGYSVVWKKIHDRLNPLLDAILSRKALTVAGLAVLARAITIWHADYWDDGAADEYENERKFIETVCAFVGVTPVPLLVEMTSPPQRLVIKCE